MDLMFGVLAEVNELIMFRLWLRRFSIRAGRFREAFLPFRETGRL